MESMNEVNVAILRFVKLILLNPRLFAWLEARTFKKR